MTEVEPTGSFTMAGLITWPDAAGDLLPQLPPGGPEADHQANGKHGGPHTVSRWEAFQNFPCVHIQAEEGEPFRLVDEPRRCHDAIDTEGQLVVHGAGAGGEGHVYRWTFGR